MALIDLDLGGSGQTTIDSSNANDNDTLNITALGSHELIVDGVSVTTESLAGIEAGASPTFTATNGGSLTVDQGLLNVSALNGFTFNVEDVSDITLNGSDVSALNGLNSYNLNFSGTEDGSFTYSQPTIALADNMNFDVTGMEAGDQFTIDGDNWNTNYSYDSENGILQLTTGGDELGDATRTTVNANIQMTQAQYDDFNANSDTYLSGDGSFTYNCFAAGTLIATPEGDVAVESLSIGDLVLTASGEAVPVKWIGRQSVSRLTAVRQPPVRIRQNALGDGKPQQDLVLTGGHGMIIDGLVINAAALVNGDTIDYVPQDELQGAMTYFHVETDSHETILANGAEAETYIDYVDRQAFDNYAEYVALYGIETRVVEMPCHRISSRRLLPLALCERLGIQDMTQATRTA